jgi:hypothetical protein
LEYPDNKIPQRLKNLSIRLGFLSFLTISLSACIFKRTDENAVVKVGDQVLTWNTLMDVIPDNSSPEDSVELAQRFIQDWVKEQLVLRKAEVELAEEKREFQELIENYRKSLLTYTFEQEWVKQKLDTIVTEQEIEDYYLNHENNFELRSYIVKVKFCAVSIDHKKQIPQLKKLFSSVKEEDYAKWEQMCVELGASYYFNEDKWLLWDEFIKKVPLEVMDVEAFLRRNQNIEFEKDNNIYLLMITDYQLSGSRSPLSFEREKIKAMIINKRRVTLLENMRNDLYLKAMQDNEVKTYYGQQQK